MNGVDHERLEVWVTQLGGTAVLGFICTLLIAGKFLHHVFQHRGLVCGLLIVPPAMLSGLLGLLWFCVMDWIDPVFTNDLGSGLAGVRMNLINFVFAALILGLTSASSSSQHLASLRGIFTSLLHEGMPMVIYSQILIWGHSTVCLLACVFFNALGAGIPPLFAAMVPLGIEAGTDIIVAPSQSDVDTQIVVEESESLGLVAACFMGIFLISSKPYFTARGWFGFGAGTALTLVQQGAGQAEHFERSTSRANIAMRRSFSQGQLGVGDMKSSNDDIILDGKGERPAYASLGAHLSLIALTVFMSFGLSLSSRLIEIELGLPVALSGVRLFKVSMVCALVSMQFIIRRSRIKFKREWFMRLCGLMLDLLVIASLSRANPKPHAIQRTHYAIVTGLSFLCLLWNFFCFIFVARHLFPNFWFERGLTLSGEALGHSYMGLLFVRTMDPAMESPVAGAYAAKLLCFFIPSSGAKNAIVVNIVSRHGPYTALFIALCVVSTWFVIFEQYFKNRYIKDNSSSSSSGGAFDGARSRNTSKADMMDYFDSGPDGALASMLSYDQRDEGYSAKDEAHGLDLEDMPPSSGSSSSSVLGGQAPRQPPSPSSGGRRHSLTEGRSSGSVSSAAVAPAAFPLTAAVPTPTRVQTSDPSSICSHEQLAAIAAWLGDRQSSRRWTLKYCLRRDGASMDTLLSLSCMRDRAGKPTYSNSVIIIEDSWGYIFGVFIAHALENKSDYYGSGESFVFTVAPEVRKYKWTGNNSMFLISNPKTLVVGGGGDGFALQLDDELDTGVSSHSATYDNPQLSSGEFFRCLNCEVWNLDSLSLGDI